AVSAGFDYAGAGADVGEHPLPVVAIEREPARRQASWTAVDWNALPSAVGIFAGPRHCGEVELEVVGDEQVQVAIPVVVDESTSGSPARARFEQARLAGDVGERSIAVVAVQDVLPPIRDEEVLVAVVVIVSNGDRGRPALPRQACLGGDVGESAVAIVLVQAIRSLFGGIPPARTG